MNEPTTMTKTIRTRPKIKKRRKNEYSLLSDTQIKNHLELGSVVIDPYIPENLNNSSYDVTLGPYYFRENRDYPLPGNIYNVYDESHVRHVWQGPLKAAPVKEIQGKYHIELENISPLDEVILLKPQETILAHTNEYIGGTHGIINTMMKARSSLGRNFIEVCKCAGWGDVGYINRWTMEITNNSRHYTIPLVVGRRVAQIVFFETGDILEKDYAASGKYQTAQ